jgi:hypothetical protein
MVPSVRVNHVQNFRRIEETCRPISLYECNKTVMRALTQKNVVKTSIEKANE